MKSRRIRWSTVSSHSTSFIYPVVVPTQLRIVMNLEFALIPVLGPSLFAMGSRVVIRQRPAQAKRVMTRVLRDMRAHGHAYGMSIEGRRSPDGRLSPFKKGAAVLAIEAQARVVPFFVEGSYEALPYGAWKVRPGRLHAIALEAIDTRGLTHGDRDDLTARLRALAETEWAQRGATRATAGRAAPVGRRWCSRRRSGRRCQRPG